MPATALIPHSSLLTGSDSGWGVGMGKKSEVDDPAHNFSLNTNESVTPPTGDEHLDASSTIDTTTIAHNTSPAG
nr:unnamed protein product [Spirometra erinaceieuropaei]